MNSLKQFVALLSLLFALPWVILVVYPSIKLSGLSATSYKTDAGVLESYPPVTGGLAVRGSQIYAQNGCAYCHTQMIRPTYAGTDRWRPGWAGREKDGDNPATIRETVATDYLGEKFAPLGVQRLGPDLSNVGWRRPDAAWHYQHLYDPRSLSDVSVMPAFRNLFKVRKVTGQRSKDALEVKFVGAAGEELEVVPTPDAKALVAYLQSLKKDSVKPESLTAQAGAAK